MNTYAELEKERIRLLLVDDSDDFRQLVQAYLKIFPFDITEAPDGSTALEMMKHQSFDVVLMDLKMPDMDGVTATRLFRQWEKDVGKEPLLIIALSAFSLKQDRDQFYEAGCNEYLAKPVRRQDLVLSLTTLLDRYSLRA